MTLKDELSPLVAFAQALPGEQSYLLHLNPGGTEWRPWVSRKAQRPFEPGSKYKKVILQVMEARVASVIWRPVRVRKLRVQTECLCFDTMPGS